MKGMAQAGDVIGVMLQGPSGLLVQQPPCTWGTVCPLSSQSLAPLEERTGRASGWDQEIQQLCVRMSQGRPHLRLAD